MTRPDHDAPAEPLDQGSDLEPHNPRRRPGRHMPYSMKEHPEHEGAVSLVRSGSVATQWEFQQLCERFPEKVVAGIKDLLKTERGQQIAALLKKEIGDGSE